MSRGGNIPSVGYCSLLVPKEEGPASKEGAGLSFRGRELYILYLFVDIVAIASQAELRNDNDAVSTSSILQSALVL